MKSSIKDATQSYYQQASLNDEAADRLSAMLAEDEQKQSQMGWSLFSLKPQWLVACCVMLLSAALLLLPSSPQSIEMDIAKEVVKNHIKMKPLELESNDITVLRNYFTELDFSLISSQRYNMVNMLGARYCSIKGVTAAQIRYQLPIVDAGSVVSLYEVEYDAALFGDVPRIDEGQAPKEITFKGLLVKLWVEKGILMVSVAEL